MKEVRVYTRSLVTNEIVWLAHKTVPAAEVTAADSKKAADAGQQVTNNTISVAPSLFIDKDRLTITGGAGQVYTLLVTTSLTKPWAPLATLTNVTGTVEFVDPDASKFSERFYQMEVR
jgi:hypothetical protein